MFALALAAVALTSTVTVPLATLALISGLVIPLLTGLVTKQRASSAVKALVNAALAAVAAGIGLLTLNGGTMELKPLIIATVVTFITSGSVYNHLWKPLGVAEYIQALFPNKGIGNGPVDLGGNELEMLDVKGAVAAGIPPSVFTADGPTAIDRNPEHGINDELRVDPDDPDAEPALVIEVVIGDTDQEA